MAVLISLLFYVTPKEKRPKTVSSQDINMEDMNLNDLNNSELDNIFKQLESMQSQPYVIIVEQPAKRSTRFRYLSEGKWAGSIRGVNYTALKKSYPMIQVIGYVGTAWVEVSCVLDYPYKQHPYQLVGKEGCQNGVCILPIPVETMSLAFSNLGIHCVKKDEIEDSLNRREVMRIDPFEGGFSHAQQLTPKHLKSVRLCFQVYIEENGNKVPLEPIVSDPIINQKKPNKLIITKLSHCVCVATGSNHEIMMFCEKIDTDDIEIRFYKESNSLLVWEDFGSFEEKDIHKEVGISFKAPRYLAVNITEPVEVFLQLRRPSDGICSEGLRFEYHPIPTNLASSRTGAKRPRYEHLDTLQYKENFINLPSTSNAQENVNVNLNFQPNMLLNNPSYPHNNALIAAPITPLPSFNRTWTPLNRSNAFLNTNNLGQVHLIDSDIGEESQNLSQDLLIPNHLPQVAFNNLPISNNDTFIKKNIETSHGQKFNWRLNNGTG